MAEVPSASVPAASSPSPPLRDRERPSRRQRSSRMSKKRSIGGRTTKAAPAGASDTTEMTKVVHVSMILCCDIEAKSAAESSRTLVARHCFHEHKFKTPFTACENDCALVIDQLMKDAGIDYEEINSELTVTCKAQNFLYGSCSSYLRRSAPGDTGSKGCLEVTSCSMDQLRDQVNKSSQNNLMPPMYTTQNPVSSGSFADTTSGMLCAAITTDRPSTGAHSGNLIWIPSVTVGVALVVLLTFLYCKFKGVSQCHKQPRGCDQHQEQPRGWDQHQEQPQNPEWPRGQDCPAKILTAGAAPSSHGYLTLGFAPFMEIKSQEITVSCGDIGKMKQERLINMIAWKKILRL